MPQLDSASPNPKQPARAPKAPRTGLPPLPPAEQERRRKLMWVLVGGFFVLILVGWFITLPGRLASSGSNQSAWTTLKDKFLGIFSFGKGDDKIKKIDVNAPTPEDLQYLREQVFPAATPAANTNTAANVNAPATSNGNTNAQ